METAIKQTARFFESVGYRTRLILLSVLFPGFIVVCECLVAAWLHVHGTLSFADLKSLSDFIGDRNVVLVLFLSLLVLAASFAAGFIGRLAAFAASDWLIRRGHFPRRSFDKRLEYLKHVYTEEKVKPVLDLHSVFKLIERERSTVHKLPRAEEFYIREYCKLWLRVKAPSVCTDHAEIEINVFLSLVIPIALASIPILFADRAPANIAAAVFLVIVSTIMLLKINESRCYETEEALVHFLFAHWEKLDKRAPARGARSKRAAQTASAATAPPGNVNGKAPPRPTRPVPGVVSRRKSPETTTSVP